MSLLRRYLPLLTLFISTASFYLYDLSGVGLLSTDEPRYAAVGRTMAQTGDWITPVLWGTPWFEKPPLLYWLTAIATSLGAGPELSARLPIALLSLVFLAAFLALLTSEFGFTAAVFATATLATSASWIAESNLCLTDLPLACFFCLAVLIVLPLVRGDVSRLRTRLLLSGLFLGLAVLAKGLVPLVLILPACWFLRRYWRTWWLAIAGCLCVSLPWYVLVYLRNGSAFVQDFFLKQHFQRFYSKSLEHVQPWYYYLPVLLAVLFPWTPLFVWLKTRLVWDQRRRFLLCLILFAVIFFSASLNKLAGYLLPVVPLLFALLGSTFEGHAHLAISKRWLIPCACLIALIPLVAEALPSILAAGRISALDVRHISATRLFYVAVPIAVVMAARRSWAPILLMLCVIAGGFFVKITTFPLLDQEVSARVFWNSQIKPVADNVCELWIRRTWVYGLSFYRGKLIPPCYLHPAEWNLQPNPGGTPKLVKR